MEKFLVDTNVLLNRPQILSKENIVISVKVLKELDGLKRSPNKETAEKARRAAIYISRAINQIEFNLEEEAIPTDDFLLKLADKYKYEIITDDVYLKIRAQAVGIRTQGSGKDEDYGGISYFSIEDENEENILGVLYQGEDCYIPSIERELKENEYLIVDTDDKASIFKKKNGEIVNVKFSTIKNQWVNTIKPRNSEQLCLFDVLNDWNSSIVLVQGRYGSGKSFCINNYALQELEKGKIKKIVYVPNNAYVANTIDLGALPGGILDKSMGQIGPLIDLIGIDMVQRMISEETLEVVPMGYIRGRSFTDSLIIINEAQNLTYDHVKLLLGRVGEGSRIFFDGDTQQADTALFKDKNGLRLLTKLSNSERFSKIFGAVKLKKVERSLAACAADYLEDLE